MDTSNIIHYIIQYIQYIYIIHQEILEKGMLEVPGFQPQI